MTLSSDVRRVHELNQTAVERGLWNKIVNVASDTNGPMITDDDDDDDDDDR